MQDLTAFISPYAVTWSGEGGVWIGAVNKNSSNFFNASEAELHIEYLDGTSYTHLAGLSYNFDSDSPYFRLFPATTFEDRNEPSTAKGGVLCELALFGKKGRKREVDQGKYCMARDLYFLSPL